MHCVTSHSYPVKSLFISPFYRRGDSALENLSNWLQATELVVVEPGNLPKLSIQVYDLRLVSDSSNSKSVLIQQIPISDSENQVNHNNKSNNNNIKFSKQFSWSGWGRGGGAR